MDNWGGYKTRWGGFKLHVARTQRVTYHFYGEKKQCLFTLRSLHLQSMNGNKIFVRDLGDRLFSEKILTPKETLPDWHETQKKINFYKFPTFHHGFFSSIF